MQTRRCRIRVSRGGIRTSSQGQGPVGEGRPQRTRMWREVELAGNKAQRLV